MKIVEVKNCKKANDRKTSLLIGISSGFTMLISIFEILDVPQQVLLPIALFLGLIMIVVALLLFGNKKK